MSPRLYRLIIRPEATEEAAEAVGWYEKRERGLGRGFLRAFRAATDGLRRNPFLYQIVVAGIRRISLRRFPYSVFYEILDGDVVVIACFHESRDPREWQERIPDR